MTESRFPEKRFHKIWLCRVVTLLATASPLLSLELGLELPLVVLSGMCNRLRSRVMQSDTAVWENAK